MHPAPALSLLLITLASIIAHPRPAAGAPDAVPFADSLVRVNSTNQAYNFMEPWSKRAPFTRRGVGVVLEGNQVLIASDLLPDYNYVEIEQPRSGRKTPAIVKTVDYRAGLALLEPVSPDLLEGFPPVNLVLDTKVGDRVSIIQLEGNGTPVTTEGLVTAVQVGSYSQDDSANLIYRVNAALLPQDGSFTVPLFQSDGLAGLLLRYDQRNQSLDAIPAPVIARFLEEARSEEYHGFAQAGIVMSNLRDPQLRRYAGLPDDQDGVYIADVRKGGPAADAGIQRGDVLLAINDVAIDRDGHYDHPLHGKLAILYHLTSELKTGKPAKFHLLRDGKPLTVEVELAARGSREEVIPSLSINDVPRYQMLGGLIFQPLTRRLLTEWGNNWRQRAPLRMVYYDTFQNDLFEPEQKEVVLMTRVLPDESNIGYEDLGMLEVTKVNDQPIRSFDDLEAALAQPVDGFHKIEFTESPNTIYLDATTVEERDPILRNNYGLPPAGS